jgi:hypothetical protein
MSRLLRDLHASCKREDGTDDAKKGTQLLEIYALEIQVKTTFHCFIIYIFSCRCVVYVLAFFFYFSAFCGGPALFFPDSLSPFSIVRDSFAFYF